MTTTSADTATTPAAGEGLSVCVLGLGAMGLPMATNLTTVATVHGFDPAAARADLAREAGITVHPDARSAAAVSDVVLLAVRDGGQLHEVLFGEAGIAEVLSPGSVVLMTSTVGIGVVVEAAEKLAGLGVGLVDAPLSGGPARAGAGDLLVVVGASPADRDKAAPVLEAMSSTLVVVGDKAGDGQAMKTVNQLLCGVHIAAAAEALALADRLGLDLQRTLDGLRAGAAASFMLGNRGPRMLQAWDEEGAEVLSRLDIFVKDLGIVGKAAREHHLAAPVAVAAEQLFLLGEAQGLGLADDSAVIRTLAPQRPGSAG
ncbi:NAD(P)-dependent oxidoreductase [Nocardioides sp. GY 10127]|uniref:NAD(P)-dependent oxidoreductase n=1 Tax=Nocardioides sp. GY 10127 TaxID=2569762 RepID=UPI0010A92554|nr:NAD(P)-dependent oxidoreductase [Nocardioides sp. GY 10127]TIC79986.1 NAD(P)-dependent oxidoreductase [Nocardioides sp. GY 10127]